GVGISRREGLLCAAASGVAFVNLVLGTRFILRDTLWVEVLFTFLGLAYFALLLSRAERFRRLFALGGGAALAALIAANAAHSQVMLKRIDANYNHYGWQEERWEEEVYHGNQRLYTKLMTGRYGGDSLRPALRRSRDHRTVRNDAEFVFPNLRPTHREIGLAWEGMPVWTRDRGYRIAALPEALRGAIVVDAGALPLQPGPLLVESLARAQTAERGKVKPHSGRGLML